MTAKLILQDGTILEGESFGATNPKAGEVVFSTGMVGYPEGITDPSYQGQILVLTYPIIGNYGVPGKESWESENIKISGLLVSTYNDTPSHFSSRRSLAQWLQDENIPGIQIRDTRALTQKLRDEGSKLGKIVFDPFDTTQGHSERSRTNEKDIPYYDPNNENLVAQVSVKKLSLQKSYIETKKCKTIVYIDCGGKKNMIQCLQRRGAHVVLAPWDFDPFVPENVQRIHDLLKENGLSVHIDGIVVSNGPGDPKYADVTIRTTKKALGLKIPLLGICLGHQLLALAGGGDTKKLKFGHRSQNQPCIMEGSPRCFITTQNHGFAVNELPRGFKTWFTNANDGSNEGIIHTKHPFMSVQFHPEATPGPQDTEWIFDYYLEKII